MSGLASKCLRGREGGSQGGGEGGRSEHTYFIRRERKSPQEGSLCSSETTPAVAPAEAPRRCQRQARRAEAKGGLMACSLMACGPPDPPAPHQQVVERQAQLGGLVLQSARVPARRSAGLLGRVGAGVERERERENDSDRMERIEHQRMVEAQEAPRALAPSSLLHRHRPAARCGAEAKCKQRSVIARHILSHKFNEHCRAEQKSRAERSAASGS